jgi:hypothetical protein
MPLEFPLASNRLGEKQIMCPINQRELISFVGINNSLQLTEPTNYVDLSFLIEGVPLTETRLI